MSSSPTSPEIGKIGHRRSPEMDTLVSKPALQKTRDPGIRDPSSIDISRKIFEISRKIFEISRKIFEIWQYNITNKKTAYYFFEPLVQPFEHFKHCNTDIITLYTHAY